MVCLNLNGIREQLPLREPQIDKEEDVEEIKRLMKRKIPSLPDDDDVNCNVCFGKDHIHQECPWLTKIPRGKTVGPGPDFDEVCIACGTIGSNRCCSSGSYAAAKWCDFCGRRGHWYWEDRCYKNFRRHPSYDKFWLPIKDAVQKEKEKVSSSCWTCKHCGKENKTNEEVVEEVDEAGSGGKGQKRMDFLTQKKETDRDFQDQEQLS